MSDLPVEECIGDLQAALAGARDAVLQAPPGAGKTTIAPLRLLDEPWLEGRRIVMLEPRRLATRAAATRMAFLLGEAVGETVGYTTRDERHVSARTRIEVVTEGVLTRRLQHDRSLPGVGLVIFDEVHERNLQTDVALAFALDVRRSGARPELRLLAMSATLETDRLASLLDRPAVIRSEGRQHPVDVRWAPPGPRQRLAEATAGAVSRALREQEGDVLVFLPGAGDIRRVEAELARALVPAAAVDVRPLFGALPIAEQDLALAASPAGRRRVVLSTDIAETSLTVDGVTTVVDAGQVRVPRYDPRTGLTRLQTVATSRASADQRAGRAGRTGPGVAYRLWSKIEHAARRPFPDPEIASVDLAALVLEVAVWGAELGALDFMDPPPTRAVEEGRALLRMLGALDEDGRPTAEGRAMADLPLHPRLARMVVGALPTGRGATACALAALLEERDVLRGRPDEIPVDVAERVRVIVDRRAHHPSVDGAAAAGARRRAGLLARRAGLDSGLEPVDLGECGPVLALAYPDRVAQARGGARFRLRNGSGAWAPRSDPLANEAFLVVAELDADRLDSRIRIAAALAASEVEEAAGAPVESSAALAWDTERGELRSTVTRRVDALVLETVGQPVAKGSDATQALLQQARASRLGVLRWTPAARSLQARVAFLRRVFGEEWPDVSDAVLLATIDDWLAPLLATATRRADLERIDMHRVLLGFVGRKRQAELDELAPATIQAEGGRTLSVAYDGEQPTAAVRVQDLFGTAQHPTVAGGRAPVVLQLLSPAGRPVQVTSDLPGFWAGSYAAVRKEMAGRYPKHPWPADPANERPPGPRRGRR